MEKLIRALVIFAASVILGIYAGLIALALAMPYRGDLRPPVLIASCTVAGISLCYGMVKWWEIEEGDRPPKVLPAPVVRIEQVSNPMRNASQVVPSTCPATYAQLYEVAVGVIAGGAGISNGEQEGIFKDRQAYSAFRNWLIQQGYCRWRGSTPQAGVEILDAGLEFFGTFYQFPNLTSPTERVYSSDTVLGITHTDTRHE
jgi:hypothetical protein